MTFLCFRPAFSRKFRWFEEFTGTTANARWRRRRKSLHPPQMNSLARSFLYLSYILPMFNIVSTGSVLFSDFWRRFMPPRLSIDPFLSAIDPSNLHSYAFSSKNCRKRRKKYVNILWMTDVTETAGMMCLVALRFSDDLETILLAALCESCTSLEVLIHSVLLLLGFGTLTWFINVGQQCYWRKLPVHPALAFLCPQFFRFVLTQLGSDCVVISKSCCASARSRGRTVSSRVSETKQEITINTISFFSRK